MVFLKRKKHIFGTIVGIKTSMENSGLSTEKMIPENVQTRNPK